MLFRAQATLVLRTIFRLSIDQEIFMSILGHYKKLEEVLYWPRMKEETIAIAKCLSKDWD